MRRRRRRQQPVVHEEIVKPPAPLSLRSGENHAIEQDAEKTLANGRRNQATPDKTDYLSKEQMILRQSKEVFNEKGMPDAHLMRGLYKRSFNLLAGKRPTGKPSSPEDG